MQGGLVISMPGPPEVSSMTNSTKANRSGAFPSSSEDQKVSVLNLCSTLIRNIKFYSALYTFLLSPNVAETFLLKARKNFLLNGNFCQNGGKYLGHRFTLHFKHYGK